MNPNLIKIIELSDCEWIQKRWKLQDGDYYIHHGFDVFVGVQVWHNELMENRRNPKDGIWLPVGFNPETGNWQIDDLLIEIFKMEIFNCNNYDLNCWINDKLKKLKWGSYNDNQLLSQSLLVLKLVWLRKLIEK